MMYNVRLFSPCWTLLYLCWSYSKKSEFNVMNTTSVWFLLLIFYQVNILHLLCQTLKYKSQTLLLRVRPTFLKHRLISFLLFLESYINIASFSRQYGIYNRSDLLITKSDILQRVRHYYPEHRLYDVLCYCIVLRSINYFDYIRHFCHEVRPCYTKTDIAFYSVLNLMTHQN